MPLETDAGSGAAGRERGYTPAAGADQAMPKSGVEAQIHATDDLREILITVSPSQFETLARDLKLLRAHGAESNTRAIIDAVHERASRIKVDTVHERNAA